VNADTVNDDRLATEGAREVVGGPGWFMRWWLADTREKLDAYRQQVDADRAADDGFDPADL
jgi:hypothetical protein